MSPGLGYMYFSNKDVTFKYPATRVFEIDDNSMRSKMFEPFSAALPWHVDNHKYPYNMTLIADVYSDDFLIPAGYYTVAAFVDDECRGIGQYVEDKQRMAWLLRILTIIQIRV